MPLALTGATGFIGTIPAAGIADARLPPARAAAPAGLRSRRGPSSAVIGDLARPRNMSAALEGVDAVIHSAGVGHAMSGVPEDDYRVLNTEATIGLARAAWRAGAKRFVFLSSIRAQCGPTVDTVLTEALEPRTDRRLWKSKLAAERGLAELDLDWVSLRAALVYGPGRPRQHGATDAACSVALSAAARAASRRAARCSHWKIGRRQKSRPCWQRRERYGEPFIAADPEALTVAKSSRLCAVVLDVSRTFFRSPPRCSKSLLRASRREKSTSGFPVRWSPIPRP